MSGAWGAPAAWGGAATARSQLPKGSEPCHICGDDESLVDVKLRPCGHELCLACTNRMRQNLVFKVCARVCVCGSAKGSCFLKRCRWERPSPAWGLLGGSSAVPTLPADAHAPCPLAPLHLIATARCRPQVPLLSRICRRLHRHGRVRPRCRRCCVAKPRRLAACCLPSTMPPFFGCFLNNKASAAAAAWPCPVFIAAGAPTPCTTWWRPTGRRARAAWRA